MEKTKFVSFSWEIAPCLCDDVATLWAREVWERRKFHVKPSFGILSLRCSAHQTTRR